MKLPAIFCGALIALTGHAVARAASSDPLAPVGVGPAPAAAPVQPVTETLWGVKVTDDYRYMEAMTPPVVDWIKAEGVYTRTVFDDIAGLAALQTRVSGFTGSFGFVDEYARYGGREFYQERAPGANQFDLMIRDDGKVRRIVDTTALMAANGGRPLAINYIFPSPDGKKVAVGISEGGSEAAVLYVYDAASGQRIAGPIDRAQFGPTSWSDDGSTIYFIRLKKLGPNDAGTEKFRDPTLMVWNLTSDPTPLYGSLTGHGPEIGHDETPVLRLEPGATYGVFGSINGVQNERKLWLAPIADVAKPDAWKPFVDRSDGVTGAGIRGDDIFLLSHKDAPTFKILQVKAGEPLSAARTLVPAQPGRVIEDFSVAKDALYVSVLEGVYSRLLRIPTGTDRIEEVPLPSKGHIDSTFSDPREDGLTLSVSSWVSPPIEYRYDPAARSFTDIHLFVRGDIDPADFKVSDLQAKGHDGVMIPLSLIEPRRGAAPRPTVIEAYGSYGISNLADFSSRRAAFAREGINYAVCHVRGGGELGDAWRLAGKDANKHNTWQDLISCGEDLIARGVATKKQLFIWGGSAGGITVGRAMTDRPDLFAGVLDLSPSNNALRAEFSPNGPDNIPRVRHRDHRSGVQEPLGDGFDPACEAGCRLSGDPDLDRPQRPQGLALGAGQVRRGAGGLRVAQPGAVAGRCPERPQPGPDQGPGRPAGRRLDRLREVAFRRARLGPARSGSLGASRRQAGRGPVGRPSQPFADLPLAGAGLAAGLLALAFVFDAAAAGAGFSALVGVAAFALAARFSDFAAGAALAVEPLLVFVVFAAASSVPP